ncbi:glycerophosphodiester phosphodiesterase family protein [Cryobacterium sp. SO1]|uniref:glycerophosphodiester phosphodiesterase family protein n=1 Tax=Cryobacterium sp. SO1 TaxID=1897061 RepID=UPI0010232F18|nr:glycerophosphodiester phosphodiesterase family protein [Cryobacterium sp. SO1]RZI35940.1 Glycerophosphoryl diester phosphodiesterase [Cryobacterium sp. SO1]
MTADRAAFLSPPGPRILAHRGLSTHAPENTLLAFLQAIAHGATHLETDVHASRDGVAVISHDPVLPDGGAAVNELTMAQLGRVDLGEGQNYCSLAEALAAFPEERFNIDVKSADAVSPTARAIRATSASRRVLLTSFSESRRRRVLREVPGAATSASAQGVALMLAAVSLRQYWALPRILRGIDAVQVPVNAGRLRIVTPRVVGHMHTIGVEVHVWTVNDPLLMCRLLELGVDGLVTDRCDLAAQVVARL